MNEKLATVISRVFDPFISLTLLFVLFFYQTPIFLSAFVSMLLLPLILFFIAWKTKTVSNWDVSDRRQRPKILWALVLLESLCAIFLGTTISVPVIVALFGFAIITQFWKISGHAMSAGLMTGFIIARHGWNWWPLLFIVPLVGWARVARRDHTIWQVTLGALYSWILVYFFSS